MVKYIAATSKTRTMNSAGGSSNKERLEFAHVAAAVGDLSHLYTSNACFVGDKAPSENQLPGPL